MSMDSALVIYYMSEFHIMMDMKKDYNTE